MRRLLLAGFLVLAHALALLGCYESSIPIAPSDGSAIDDRLIGDWLASPQSANDEWENDYPIRLTVRPFNSNEYLLVFQGVTDREAQLTRAYTVSVGDHDLAVLQGLGEEHFVFFEYTLANGTLTVRAIDRELFTDMTLETPEDLRAFLVRHLEDSELYMDPVRFTRSGAMHMQLTTVDTQSRN